MVAILLRPRAEQLLIVMSAFWCGVVASMVILPRLTDANPSGTATVVPEPIQTKTVGLVPVHGVIPVDGIPVERTPSLASRKFDDRWGDLEERRTLPPAINDASAQVAQAEPGDRKDPVCGERGRRYFYLQHHKYWRCRR
jgi:hypothetical protein